MPDINIHEEMVDMIASSARLRSQSRRGQECPDHGHAGSFHRQTLIAATSQNGRSFSIENGGARNWALQSLDPAQEAGVDASPFPLPDLEQARRRHIRYRNRSAAAQSARRFTFKICWAISSTKFRHKQSAAGDAVNGLLSGKNVSLHQAMISMEEASVSFQMMVEVRNKLLDSYQELMRMQV